MPSSRTNSTCTITGVIFQDNNGDGVARLAGEPPLEGMPALYLERIDGGGDPDCAVSGGLHGQQRAVQIRGPRSRGPTSSGQLQHSPLDPASARRRPAFERVHLLLPETQPATVPFGCKPQRPQSDGDPDSDADDRCREVSGCWKRATHYSSAMPARRGGAELALAGAFVGRAMRRPREGEEE